MAIKNKAGYYQIKLTSPIPITVKMIDRIIEVLQHNKKKKIHCKEYEFNFIKEETQ